MREIFFRGKTINNGKWIEGYLFENWGDAYICLGTENGNIMKEKVNEVTVGQYTGIKDENGTKIFEGDIVTRCGGEKYQGVYEYGDTVVVADTIDIVMLGEFQELFVLGNIHDNPEKK